MNTLNTIIKNFLDNYPPAAEVYTRLSDIGDVYVLGGILREYLDKRQIEILRDADFTVEVKDERLWEKLLEDIPHRINRFGGYKFDCGGFYVDIWRIENTWAFANGRIPIVDADYFQKITSTVFLNMDGLVYDVIHNRWNCDIYLNAKKTNILDVVLADNPYLDLNILRAVILRRRYDMEYSKNLKRIIYEEYCKDISSYIDRLFSIQLDRYKGAVISKADIKADIDLCCIEFD